MKTTRAADVMTTNVITVTRDKKLTQVMDILLRWHISGLPVVDEQDKLIGIVSEIDLVNMAFDGNAADTTVEEVMTTDVTTFGPEADLTELAHCFAEKRLRRVPIVKRGRILGIVSRRDILREMLKRYDRY